MNPALRAEHLVELYTEGSFQPCELPGSEWVTRVAAANCATLYLSRSDAVRIEHELIALGAFDLASRLAIASTEAENKRRPE